MTDELPPLDTAGEGPAGDGPADTDEQRSATALARALDTARGEPGLPQAELEAAALLRFVGGATLGEQRRRAIRAELIAGLPATPRAARGWRRRWLLWTAPLASAAAAATLLWIARDVEAPRAAPVVASPSAAAERSALTLAEPLAAREPPSPAAASGARGGARRALLTELSSSAQALRQDLLARSGDAALAREYAALDGAQSRPELERSERALRGLTEALGERADGDGQLIRQDIYCRLAETALRLGEPSAALEWARRGLALDGAPTPFLAQLQALEGDAWAALGQGESAAQSYLRALRLHEQLLGDDLDGR